MLIDRRPLGRVLLDHGKHPVAMLFALGLLALPWFVNGPSDLPLAGWRVLGLFGACSILWISQAIPLGATGLFALAVLPIAGELPATQVFGYFGNSAVFFLIAAFLLAAAVQISGLSTRIAVSVFRRLGQYPRRLLATVFGLAHGLSYIMPEHAVAAMLFPIIREIAGTLPEEERYRAYSARMYLGLVWGVVTGGVVTFLGGARAPLAMGILEEATGKSISFTEWITYSVPVAWPTALIAVLMVTWPPVRDISLQRSQSLLEQRKKQLGRIKWREYLTMVAVVGTSVAWIFLGERHDLGVIGLLGVLFLVMTRAVSFKQLSDGVDWSVIFLYGGAIALGKISIESGAAPWLADAIMPDSGSIWIQLVVLAAMAMVLTELISNSAVVALLLPMALSTMPAHGQDPILLAVTIALMSGFVFSLPIGTPAMSLAFSSGLLQVSQTMKRGLVLAIVALTAFMISIQFRL